jgi:hypothetical protein
MAYAHTLNELTNATIYCFIVFQKHVHSYRHQPDKASMWCLRNYKLLYIPETFIVQQLFA